MALNVTPNANDRISDTQPLILQNFNTINAAFNVNHGEYLTGDQGKHKFVTFLPQNPVPVFAGTDEGMYSVASIAGPNPTINGPEIYLKKFYNSGVSSRDIPFTASFISNTNPLTNNQDGWTYLPSGILVKWGSISNPAGTNNFPVGAGIPVFTNCFRVFVVPANLIATQNGIGSGTCTAVDFNVSGNLAGGPVINWLAIGW